MCLDHGNQLRHGLRVSCAVYGSDMLAYNCQSVMKVEQPAMPAAADWAWTLTVYARFRMCRSPELLPALLMRMQIYQTPR
mgnify:CR=1 FL=1